MTKIQNTIPLLLKLFLCTALFSVLSCVDTDPPDNGIGNPTFASGPSSETGYSFAQGMIRASNETLGIFMKNTSTGSSVETAASLSDNHAYMGFVQEDIFRYAKAKYLTQYNDNPVTAKTKYLKIASQLKAIMAAYRRNVYLLINTNLVTGVTDIEDLTKISSPAINIGTVDSDTYVTAKSITDAYTFSGTPVFTTDSAETGIKNVIGGKCHAAFLVDDISSSLLKSIASNAPVQCIAVTMPTGKKYYTEDCTIFQGDYPFQNSTVTDSISVKSVLACCPLFSEKSLKIFLDYVLTHTAEYRSFHPDWINVSKDMTSEFIKQNPFNCNYHALCYFMDVSPLTAADLQPYFCSAEAQSTSHDMASELMWLLSHNLDIDLKEKTTTGTWENSYWMQRGSASMALVGNDISNYLLQFEDKDNIMQAASMQKVAPLNYEYVHLAVNTDSAMWSWKGGTPPTTLAELFTNNDANNSTPVLYINVGPKTSGTFISAMAIINSYKTFDSADAGTTPDMQEMEIHYSFDSASDSIANLEDGNYHAAFVTSGVPYNRFYPHDTYAVPSNIKLIPALFYNNTTPYPYEIGKIAGNATTGDYPYRSTLLPSASGNTVRLRSLIVSSPAFEFSSVTQYIISIFRKAYYKVYTSDPGNPDFSADPLWISVMVESILGTDADYETYEEDIIGAKEYFVNDPFGWDKSAAEYYISMFPDNQ